MRPASLELVRPNRSLASCCDKEKLRDPRPWQQRMRLTNMPDLHAHAQDFVEGPTSSESHTMWPVPEIPCTLARHGPRGGELPGAPATCTITGRLPNLHKRSKGGFHTVVKVVTGLDKEPAPLNFDHGTCSSQANSLSSDRPFKLKE